MCINCCVSLHILESLPVKERRQTLLKEYFLKVEILEIFYRKFTEPRNI